MRKQKCKPFGSKAYCTCEKSSCLHVVKSAIDFIAFENAREYGNHLAFGSLDVAANAMQKPIRSNSDSGNPNLNHHHTTANKKRFFPTLVAAVAVPQDTCKPKTGDHRQKVNS